MREIRFRAWDLINKRWIRPWTLKLNIDGHILAVTDMKDLEMYGLHQVEVMQYTGLKDKNGKEIYEGDIVRDGNGDIREVVFGKIGYDGSWNGLTGFGFRDKTEKDGGDEFLELEYYDAPKELEVIGNVYENPELLDTAGKQA